MNPPRLPAGLWVALATPFDQKGALDRAAFARIVKYVVKGGVDTVVVLGSTGEAATLHEDERDVLIELALEHRGSARVVVGTGHNATDQACRLTRRALDLGAHGALVVTPYYNRPTPAGIAAHFAAIAKTSDGLPLVAYNVPARTGSNLTPAALALLWELDAVVAVKESSGSLAQIDTVAREMPAGKMLLAGDDPLALASIAVGAAGLVSVVANVLPAATRAWIDAALAGDRAAAIAWQARLMPVIDALSLEPNPIALKAALAHAGLSGAGCRLPLLPPSAATRAAVAAALDRSELLMANPR